MGLKSVECAVTPFLEIMWPTLEIEGIKLEKLTRYG
jgi:hypothetical protein